MMMKSYFKIVISVFFIAIFLGSMGKVFAQVPSSIDGIDMSIVPEIPVALQNVTINVGSFSTDINSASIVWMIDGKTYAKGTGLKSITITAPPVGKTTNVVAAILTVEGREVKKTVTIKPSGVDLIWESGGYVPPFYKGKTSFAYQNPIKITAVPHLSLGGDKEISPGTLVYKWKENDKVIQDQSGYGKQTLTLKEDIPKTMDIQVEVTTTNGSQKGSAFLTLEPGDPSVSFYEEDPLYGVLYNKEIVDQISLSNQEVTIRAVPFSFNFTLTNSPLVYNWSINNLDQPSLNGNQSVVLRTKDDNPGSSLISLNMTNTNDILQGAENAINIYFSKPTASAAPTFQ